MRRSWWSHALLSLAALGCACRCAGASATTAPVEVNLLAIGDWGFDSPDRQAVADAMAADAGARPDAVLLLGDNFRTRLKDENDPAIQRLFEHTYDPIRLACPFYAALGNHDYEQDKALIEMAYASGHPQSRWKMPARWYRVDLPSAAAPLVTVLALDSNKPKMSPADWTAQIDWMGRELAGPRGRWTICCAHHPLFSNGSHGDNGVLQTQWGPLLKQRHVDFYLSGHDHTLQHLEIANWPISFVISGGGGARRTAMLRDVRGPFSRSEMGFTHLRFTADMADVRLVDAHDATLHEFSRDLKGAIHVISTTASDPATRNPLKLIQGLDDADRRKTTPSTQPTSSAR